MAFSYLSNDVVGKEVIPAVWQGQLGTNADPSDGGKRYTTEPDGRTGGLYGQLRYEIAQQPAFDKTKAVYTPTDQTGDSVKVDNTNGLNPETTVQLSYSAESGATATTETTTSVTAGVSEEVDVGFPDIGDSKTTFNLSGTFSYSEGTSTSKTVTQTNTVEDSVKVPAGKIYEATIFYTQEILTVPYTLQVFVPDLVEQGPTNVGVFSNAWFNPPPDPNNVPSGGYGAPPSFIFGQVQQYRAAGADSKLYSSGQAPDGSGPAGVVTLSGKAVMSNYGDATTKVFDVTNQTTGATAVVDEGAGVGVRRTLGDGGEAFTASRFDDWVEGGAGDDRLYLNAGGNDRAEGKGGDDRIQALNGGRHALDGGDGHDHLLVQSDQAFSQLRGGAGNDLIEAYAPKSILTGGGGDDTYVLDARSAGSVIVGHEGRDKLELAPGGRVVLERVGADLFVHADGDAGSYDPAADIAWLDFFAGDGGEVNGLGAAGMASLFDQGGAPVYSPDTGAWSAFFGGGPAGIA